MKAYFFDDRGLFQGSRDVDKVSAKATDKKPPETWPPDIPRWTGADWEIVQDQTHRTLYHKLTRAEYIPQNALEQVDMSFYTETPPPGKSDYEYWDDATKTWLVDTSREDADKADEVRARLVLQLPELLSDPTVDSLTALRQRIVTRKADIAQEVG